MGRRLVRDRALENWVVPGAEHQVRPVTGRSEHARLLMAKLVEEAMEVIMAESQTELIKEIGDILSVLEAIAHVDDVSWEDVLAAQNSRHQASGGFTEGLVWETSR